MKNKKLNIILIIVNILAYLYFKNNLGSNFNSLDVFYVITPLVLLGLFFSKVKNIIWTLGFISVLCYVLYENNIIKNNPCSHIGCDINMGGLYAMYAFGIFTLVLVLTQIIQYFIKRSKEKNRINNIA